jgi:hypothetical protein
VRALVAVITMLVASTAIVPILFVLQLASAMADEKDLIDKKTHELMPRGLMIQLIALAQVVEMKCNTKGQITAALAKAGKAGIIINLNDKVDFADELFMASRIVEEVNKTGADKWCEKTGVATVQFLSKP